MTEPEQRQTLDAAELGAYFALIEVGSLVRHAVEQQLRDVGDLSYVQFQLLATLGDAPGGDRRMTELADGVVISRSGLTYQVGLLEKVGLVVRRPAVDDDRGVTVALTRAGRARLAEVFPGHVALLRELVFDAIGPADVADLGRVLGRVRDHMRTVPPRSAKPRRRPPRSAD
ncbi:MarR family winged helix-turn-helix transcriptional regulator [Curtobacterium sp. 'Ferrero']|uniref:MarR family winged helix-turn-helix transcriptional regulator n=1 Tax=Curtobacterium sp. 'Ferrero' TaxID=2033654 RepID=UPI0020D169C4|nr:MarR family winged helix-turn-helix transcriptional regulator [Curtobacterium sp. 'Ferrero']